MSSTAVIKRAEDIVPQRPLTGLAELSQKLLELRHHDAAFVLTPVTYITEIRPFHQIVLRMVKIDPDPAKREVYKNRSFCKDDEVALGKTALVNILGVAGASPLTHRLDDRSDQHYAEFAAVVYNTDHDGITRQYPGHKAVDLRDGSPQAKAMKPDQLAMARQFIAENAESKAVLRAIRPLFGLSQVYKIDDLKRKPFVVLKLVQHWDLNDPDQKAAAIRQAESNTTRLFGGGMSAPASEATAPPQIAERTEPPPAGLLSEAAAKPPVIPQEPTEEMLDGELPDFAEPTIVVCGCPCGHQLEVTPDVAELTKQATGGAIRCATCYPGRSFEFKAHKDLPDLCIPKYPGLTAERVREKWSAKDAAEKKK